MRPGVRSLAALAALALAACSNARAPTPEAAVPGLAVKLEAPGAAPRRVVRFAFVKGARATLDLRLDLQLGVEVNRQRMDIPPLPGLAVRVTVTIAEVLADGSARWSAEFARATAIASPGVAPETVAALTAALPTDKTFTATGVVTPRGALREAALAAPGVVAPEAAQFLDAVRQLLHQMACPLPAEPIGVGARWEVRTELDNDGMKLTHIATNEVVAMRDGQLELKQTVRQEALPQTVATPQAPGSTTTLEALAADGTASVVVDLARPWPATYSLSFQLDTMLATTSDGQRQALGVRMSMLAQATTVP
jgi:hypothetical protein